MSQEIDYERAGGTLFLRLPPEIDHHSSQEIRERTEGFLQQGGIRLIVFDFSRAVFMDSSGIGAILGRLKRMRELGGAVAVCHADARMRRILRISGVDRLVSEWKEKGDKDGKDEF